jgi:hypothetical protein
MPSSVRTACTTLASSIGDNVRGGALLASNSDFVSAREHARSTTTGTVSWPPSRQARSRLKPSTTCSRPSSIRTALIGSSLSFGLHAAPRAADPQRSGASEVDNSSGETRTTSGQTAAPACAGAW